jgi:osmotically inducible protein OsmC
MPIAERSAQCSWNGDLAHGSGSVSSGSGALSGLEVTWASRTQRSEGRTSPEELVAAAHASCFSMALAHGLAESGNPPERLSVTASVTLAERDGAPTVTISELSVSGRVPGIDHEAFIKAATDAGKGCPISRAMDGVEIRVSASLE